MFLRTVSSPSTYLTRYTRPTVISSWPQRPFQPFLRAYADKPKGKAEPRPLRNKEILQHLRSQYRPLRAYVVDEHGKLHPEPTELLPLIERVDKKDPEAGIKFPEFFVQLIVEHKDKDVPNSPPVVKIISKKEFYMSEKAKKEKKFDGRVVEKVVQMRWEISDVDFERKMSQAKEELDVGHRVNVHLSAKDRNNGYGPTRQLKHETVEKIGEALKEHGKLTLSPDLGGRVTILHYWPLTKKSGSNNKTGQHDNTAEERENSGAAQQQ